MKNRELSLRGWWQFWSVEKRVRIEGGSHRAEEWVATRVIPRAGYKVWVQGVCSPYEYGCGRLGDHCHKRWGRGVFLNMLFEQTTFFRGMGTRWSGRMPIKPHSEAVISRALFSSRTCGEVLWENQSLMEPITRGTCPVVKSVPTIWGHFKVATCVQCFTSVNTSWILCLQ